jgi:hypothetical protein
MSALPGAESRAASRDASLWLAGQLLGSPVLEVDSALLSIAAAYGRCDAVTVLGRLDGAARILFGCRRERCEVQAERLAMVLTNVLGLIPEHEDPRALLIDDALESRRAHPVVIAGVGSELARRAGLRGYVCQSPEGWWTGISAHGETTLVGTSHTASEVPQAALRGLCPHRLAGAILTLFAEHREQSWRLPADRLRRALPDCGAGVAGG